MGHYAGLAALLLVNGVLAYILEVLGVDESLDNIWVEIGDDPATDPIMPPHQIFIGLLQLLLFSGHLHLLPQYLRHDNTQQARNILLH